MFIIYILAGIGVLTLIALSLGWLLEQEEKCFKDYRTWEYYKDKDLLMRKQTLRENFYRLLTNLKGKQ